MVFRPDRSGVIFLAAVLAPAVAAGAWFLIAGDLPTKLTGCAVIALLLFYWGQYLTVRILIDDQTVTMERFGRVVWSLKLSDVVIRKGPAAWPLRLTAFLVGRRGQPQPVGEILPTQFGPEAQKRIIAALTQGGADVSLKRIRARRIPV